MVAATVDLDQVSSYRNSKRSRCYLSSLNTEPYRRVYIDMTLSNNTAGPLTAPIVWQYHTPEEEICFGPACWLWDYLRCVDFFFFNSKLNKRKYYVNQFFKDFCFFT